MSESTSGQPIAYPIPALTADWVIFVPRSEELCVLLIRRANEPFEGFWAFPGGHAEPGEEIIETAARELREETCVELVGVTPTLVGVFSKPGRDPRGWYVTVAYTALVDEAALAGAAAIDPVEVREVRLFPLSELPPLAFDHAEILEAALAALGLEDYLSNGLGTPQAARGTATWGFTLSDREYARLSERCPECTDLRAPELRYLIGPDGQELHVVCPCCGSFRHNQEDAWRAADDWAGGLCEHCRSPLEVGMRAHVCSLSGQIGQIEDEIAQITPTPELLRFAALERAHEELIEERRMARPRCDGSR